MKLKDFLACGSCGLIFKDQIDEKSNQEAYRKYYQEGDPHERVAESKRFFFDSVLNVLDSKIARSERSILDVGCGYGYFLQLAAKRGWNISGVEIVESAVQEARLKLGTGEIFRGVLKKADYAEHTFDAVTLWDLLDFVGDPLQELKECHRVLKNGGTIGIRVRNARFQKLACRIYSIMKYMTWVMGLKTPYKFHPYCYTDTALTHLLRRVGFSRFRFDHSPLTRGDPYSHTCFKALTSIVKKNVDFVTKCLFVISGGRWIVGPSLLVWAEKPKG